MSWTAPRTWVYNELVDETDMNTHVRDQFIFLKSNPLISETTLAATNQYVTNGAMTVLTLSSVAIPSDVGAVYVEAWGHWSAGLQGDGHNNAAIYISDTTAGEVCRNHMYDYSFSAFYRGDNYRVLPFRLRSQDLAWAGTTRTVTLNFWANNWTIHAVTKQQQGSGQNTWAQPIVLRIVRSY